MGELIENLEPWEILLMILGTVLFIVLIYILLHRVKNKEDIKSLFFYFIFPIVMIGYPSIVSIKVSQELVEITNTTRELEQEPNNENARKKLRKDLSRINFSRIEKNPKALYDVAKGEKMLKDYDNSLRLIDQSL